MRLSIQLCTFNRAALLERVLEALFDQTLDPAAYEVVLVDDGSTDETAAVIERARPLAPCAFTAVRQANGGLAKARNAGLAHVRGARVCFIDDDVLPTPVFAAEHLATDARCGDVIVRGAVINAQSFDDLPPPFWSPRDYSANYFWTSNVSVRMERLARAGGRFDESFAEYGWEDIELGLRLRALGTKAVFNRRALAFHYKPRAQAVDPARRERQARAGAHRAAASREASRLARRPRDRRDRAAARARRGARAQRDRAPRPAPRASEGRAARRRRLLHRAAAIAAVIAPQRILLSRTDRLGDLILSTPAIATIRASFPAAHVTIVCSRYNAVVVDGSPDVDAVERLPEGASTAEVGARYRGVDLAIALAPNSADLRLVAATRAPVRIGYTYRRRYITRLAARSWLTEMLISDADPGACERRPAYHVRHEVDQVLALAERAGARTVVRDLRLVVSDADRAAVADFPAGPIVVHLGQRWTQRGSSSESLLALLVELRALGRPVIATYGDDARELAERVRASGSVERIVGGVAFGVWAAAFERAACVVTIDTGATHVASAMHRPTVVLFEHRYFRLASQEWSPYRVPNAVLRKPASDAPEALRASRAEIVAAVARLL